MALTKITSGVLGDEYTSSAQLSPAAEMTVDTSAADIFTFTAAASSTLNFTNVIVGDMKTLVIIGGGGSYTITLGTMNGASATYNLISGDYDDTSAIKNFIQIKFISTTEAWYTISQILI